MKTISAHVSCVDLMALKQKSFTLVLFIFFTVISINGSARQYTFIQYSVGEGLAQSQVRCLMQDSRGYIWAGTLGGLSRFDGNKFFNFNRQNGLLNNQVNCLLELSSGIVAAGCNGSIALLSGTGVKTISLPDSYHDAVINTMFEWNNELWVGTEDGLLIYDFALATFLHHVEMAEPLKAAHIKRIDKWKQNILVMTREALFSLEAKTPSHTLYKSTHAEIHLFDFAKTNDGHLWLATRGEGLVELDAAGNFLRAYTSSDGLPVDIITGVMTASDGTLYISSRFGFFHFAANGFTVFSESEGLPTNDVRDIIQDREGNIWLATYGNGLQKFTGEKITTLTTKDGLVGDAVMSILLDSESKLWFSTFDKGICRDEGDTIIGYNLKELTGVNRIWSSLCDHQGNLWFGSSSGLFKYSSGRFTSYGTQDSLPTDMVLSLYEDNEQRLWIGTSKGLALLTGNSIRPITTADAPTKRIRCITQDKAGHLWMATNEGVYRYNGSTFKVYSQKDGLPDNSVNCVAIDGYNQVWVGTMSGLAMLQGEQFESTHIDNTAGSDVVNFLVYVSGTLWIGTNNGLHSAALNRGIRPASLIYRHYGLEDGLRSLETNQNAVFVDKLNNLWFGTTEGVTYVNTALLSESKNVKPPLLHLSELHINLQPQDWQKMKFNVDELSGLPIQPEFNYKNNHLTFYFNGISTTYPEDVRYQYMLEGLDEEWKPLTTSSSATYSNLPYRHFVFRVKALSKEGIWSEEATYAFRILPPFWLRWWFIAIEILLILGIAGIIISNRRKAIKTKREKEWFEIKSKMLALEQQSLNSSMNRHFIFNALNSIQYYINRQDKLAANRYLSDFAKLIRKNLDSSQDNLTSLRDEIERLELYLKLEHMRFKDKFNYTINVDPSLNLDHTKVPAMLVQPFLENSIWHGLLPKDAQGILQVDIAKSNGHIEFTITDNGVGIENSRKNKTGADNHISKGMEITQSRIELIKKTTGKIIELEGPYQLGKDELHPTGTIVKLKLPENFHEHFSP